MCRFISLNLGVYEFIMRKKDALSAYSANTAVLRYVDRYKLKIMSGVFILLAVVGQGTVNICTIVPVMVSVGRPLRRLIMIMR